MTREEQRLINEQVPLLTSREQYCKEVFSLPRLTQEQEIALEEAAKQGDPEARSSLIVACLSYVAAIAWRYVVYLTTDDYLDLVSVGNLALVRSMEKSLRKDRPLLYLRVVAKWEIVHHCYYHSKLMKRRQYKDTVPSIYSLEQIRIYRTS
jgi:DNA-directed RNA polymerase specialized sigma subunit